MHEPEDHVEHAAHAEHGSHDPFDRRVAITMVVVAALLAGVKVLGHRAHNATLRNEIEAGVLHTHEFDQWAFYQAKKQRQHLYQAETELLGVVAKDGSNPQAASQAAGLAADWKKKAERYEVEAKELETEARNLKAQAEEARHRAETAHHQSDRYDLGELGVELALVLCSVAILTKRPPFWYGGMIVGTLGTLVALLGLLVH